MTYEASLPIRCAYGDEASVEVEGEDVLLMVTGRHQLRMDRHACLRLEVDLMHAREYLEDAERFQRVLDADRVPS